MQSSFVSRLGLVIAVVFALLLAGCGGGLAGSTYEAKDPDGSDATVSLTFVNDKDCTLAMAGPMGKMEFNTTYTVDGNTVSVKSPMPGDDDSLILTRKGSTLTGELEGDAMTFEKK